MLFFRYVSPGDKPRERSENLRVSPSIPPGHRVHCSAILSLRWFAGLGRGVDSTKNPRLATVSHPSFFTLVRREREGGWTGTKGPQDFNSSMSGLGLLVRREGNRSREKAKLCVSRQQIQKKNADVLLRRRLGCPREKRKKTKDTHVYTAIDGYVA